MNKEQETILDTMAKGIVDSIEQEIWGHVLENGPSFITLDPKQVSRALYMKVVDLVYKSAREEKINWAKETDTLNWSDDSRRLTISQLMDADFLGNSDNPRDAVQHLADEYQKDLEQMTNVELQAEYRDIYDEDIPPDEEKVSPLAPRTKTGALMFVRYEEDTETQVRVLLKDGTYGTPIHIASSGFDFPDEEGWHPEVIEHVRKVRQ